MINKSASVESVARTFAHFLITRQIYNPRRATLSVWAEFNCSPDMPESTLDSVWDTYLKYV